MGGIGDAVSMLGLVQQETSSLGPVSRGAEYKKNQLMPNAIPSPGELLTLYARGEIPEAYFKENMTMHGYSWEVTDMITKLYRTYMSVSDYVSLYRRGHITEEMLYKEMDRQGIPPSERSLNLHALEFFPSPADLVRFAVREVYTPEIVEKFRTDEDLPAQFITEAAKAGMGEEQARNFWRSHWDLPSAQMGFVMFQRNIITYDELIVLLRTLDIMPFWRDKLIQLSYSPLTRVDVRRMYGEGVLNEEDLPQKYQDQGYSPENAKLLADFTVKYENREIKGVTRANVIAAYKNDLLDDEELLNYLKEMGYSQLVINFWWEQAIYEKAQAEINLYIDDIVAIYLAGGKSLSDVQNALNGLDIPASYVDNILRKIVTQKAKSLKVPSKEDLSEWILNGVIDDVYFATKMRMLHYDEEDIQHYLENIAKKVDTATTKYLDKDVYIRWVKSGVIPVERFRDIMRNMGYNEFDLEMLCRELGVEYAQP